MCRRVYATADVHFIVELKVPVSSDSLISMSEAASYLMPAEAVVDERARFMTGDYPR